MWGGGEPSPGGSRLQRLAVEPIPDADLGGALNRKAARRSTLDHANKPIAKKGAEAHIMPVAWP